MALDRTINTILGFFWSHIRREAYDNVSSENYYNVSSKFWGGAWEGKRPPVEDGNRAYSRLLEEIGK